MRPIHSSFLAAAVCLFFPLFAAADITGIAPQRVPLGSVEEFLTIRGSDLYGDELMQIAITGPAGQFVLEPNAWNEFELVFWIPERVAVTAGLYQVTVQSKHFDQPVRTMGPVFFTVEEIVIPTPPLLFLPESITAEANGPEAALVTFEAIALSYDGNPVPVNCSHRSGALFGLGVTTVTCAATDANGTSEDQFRVIVTDTTPPEIVVPNDIVSETNIVHFTTSALDTVDGFVNVMCDPPSGSSFPAGVTRVECVAYDAHLNPAYGSFHVTITQGGLPPVLTVPADFTVEATSAAGAVVTFAATANDGVVNCTPASGSTFPLGGTPVLCTATNVFGIDTESFNVTVADRTAPSLTLPAPIVAEATSPSGAAVTFTAAAHDLVDGSIVPSCSPASGDTFPMGQTIVTCTATDASGNTRSGTFAIDVRDTIAPHVATISANPGAIWPPNHQMVAVTVSIVAVDAVDPSPVSRIVSVSSNQPVNGTGDGDTGPDWLVTGPLTLQLRAERSGSADRTYTITVETEDASGNSVTSTVRVLVSQTKRRATG